MRTSRAAVLRARLGQGQCRPSRRRRRRRRPDQGRAGAAASRDPAAGEFPPAQPAHRCSPAARSTSRRQRGLAGRRRSAPRRRQLLRRRRHQRACRARGSAAQIARTGRGGATPPCAAAVGPQRRRRFAPRRATLADDLAERPDARPGRCRLHASGRPARLRAARRRRLHVARAGDRGAASAAGDAARVGRQAAPGLHVSRPGRAISRHGWRALRGACRLPRADRSRASQIADPIVGDDLRSQLLDRDATGGDATRAHPTGAVHLRVRAGQALDGMGPAARRHGRPQRGRVRGGLPRRRLLLRGRLPAGRHPRPHHAGDADRRHACGAPAGTRACGRAGRRRSTSRPSMRRRFAWPPDPSTRSRRSKRGSPPGTCRAAGLPSPMPSIRAPSTPALAEFAGSVPAVRLQPPRIPFVSTVTGDWITAAQAIDPAYWVQHAGRPCGSPMRSPPWRAKAGRTCWKSDRDAPCRRWRRRSWSEARCAA